MIRVAGLTTVCMNIEVLFEKSENLEEKVLRELNLKVTNEAISDIAKFLNDLPLKLQNGQEVKNEQVYKLAVKEISCLNANKMSGEIFYKTLKEKENLQISQSGVEILKYLKDKGFIIESYTNEFFYDQIRLLERFEILDNFEKIYGWDSVCAKPHRKSVYNLVNEYSSNIKDKVIFIGNDGYTDINFSRKARIQCIGCNLKQRDGGREYLPDISISDLSELKKIL